MGSIPIPDIYKNRQLYHTQPKNSTRSPSIKKTPSRLRNVTDQHGIEQLHPFQRSGSATRAQTSSEIRAATSGMAASLHHGGPQAAGRLSTSTTPAQRITLTRSTGSHAFPHSQHRASMSHQFASRPADSHIFERQDAARNEQYTGRRTTLTPNMHSRMPASRGLY